MLPMRGLVSGTLAVKSNSKGQGQTDTKGDSSQPNQLYTRVDLFVRGARVSNGVEESKARTQMHLHFNSEFVCAMRIMAQCALYAL